MLKINIHLCEYSVSIDMKIKANNPLNFNFECTLQSDQSVRRAVHTQLNHVKNPLNSYFHISQVYKSRHQRISYETYSTSSTISTLEMDPHSQVLQGLFQAVPKYQTSILLLCEVSILHVYHKNVQQRILLSMSPPTTHSPNLLESKRNGDPDALTSSTNRIHLIYSGTSSILIILFVSLYKMVAL